MMEADSPCFVQDSKPDSDKTLNHAHIDSKDSNEPPKMSKNQQKRLLREAKRKETKAEWRKLQKAKRKLKEQLKKEECISKGKAIIIIYLFYYALGVEYPVKKRIRTDPNKEKTGKIVFDLSFDGIMVNREVKSLFSQIIRCYSANRRSELPFNLEISSFNGELSDNFKAIYPEHERWDVAFNPEHFIKTESDHENIIYLTPDSDHVLESINGDFTYVIGGIVDKNRFKGKSFESANSMNIKTARLPVPEYIDLKTSPVLTIYHVFEILLKYKDCKNWKEALESYVPKRNMKNDSENGESVNSDSE